MFKSNIPFNQIVHNDLYYYKKSGYGGKNIKDWPFYNYIKLCISSNFKKGKSIWVQWLISEFKKYCNKKKSIGGMYQGSVHTYSLKNINKNKKNYLLNPRLINKRHVKQGATFLVKKRINLIKSIKKKGYNADKTDQIYAIKSNDIYILKGGHHRAAILYILGYKELKDVIVYSKQLWELRKWILKIAKFIR